MEEELDELIVPVCFKVDPDIEFKENPTNGQEFLLKVMQERQRCPAVTKCNVNIASYSSKQSVFAEEKPPIKDAPEKLQPTIEWQNIQTADFSKERMYISRLLSDKSAWPATEKNQIINKLNSDVNIPLWFWNTFFETQSPTLSTIFSISQFKIEKGLSVLIKSLDDVAPGETIPATTGQWIYAILAYIQLPLLSETISILRELARTCAEIRSNLDPQEENAIAAAAPMNLFICLVTKYFGQTDLVC